MDGINGAGRSRSRSPERSARHQAKTEKALGPRRESAALRDASPRPVSIRVKKEPDVEVAPRAAKPWGERALNEGICDAYAVREKGIGHENVQKATVAKLKWCSLDQAWNCLRKMQGVGVPVNGIVVAAMIRVCTKAGAFDQFDKVLQLLQEPAGRFRDNVNDALRDGYARAGRLDLADKYTRKKRSTNSRVCELYWRGMEGKEIVDVEKLTVSLLGLPTVTLEDAWECLDNLRDVNIPVSDIIGAAMIRLCSRLQRLDQIDEVLRRQQDSGVRPGRSTYSAIIGSCGRDKQYDAAMGWIAQMYREGVALDEPLYKEVIEVNAYGGRPRKAVSTFEAMLRDRPDIEVSEPMLTAVLIACRASRNSECALRTMELLKSLFVPKPVHYRCVMESCADDRNLPAALAAFQALAATPGFQLTSGDYSYMFDVCRRCGDRQAGDLALSLFDKLLGDRNIEPDASTLAKLVKALGKCGNWKAALHCFERAMTECPTARDARLWNALITALGDNGQTARAKAQFDRMNERSQRDRFEPVPTVATYTAMMRVYLKAGRPFEVLAWFDRMKPDHVPDARAFNTLIAALHANELTRHLAFQYVDEAVRAGVYRSSLALTGDKLDFHIASLYTAEIPREADQGLPVGLAVALFDYHWSKGNIGEKSEFIVGFHGIGVLDEVIRQCMTAAGLEPVILDDGVLAHARARMKPVDAA